MFSDYRIISSFLSACDSDVDSLKCGRTRLDPEDKRHSQGATIDCLTQSIDSVSDACKKEVFEIAEMQADDFHLDRALFLACREDKEQFCGRVSAGEGRVFRCLIKYKQSVSAACQEQLTRRQQTVARDFKADGGLIRSCKQEVKEFSCRKVLDKEGKNAVKLSQVLLCLEENIRTGQQVSGQCLNEMREIRREMMEDYNISPELVANCGHEIDQFCSDKKKHGHTIHCLMSVASERQSGRSLGDKCGAALEDFLRMTQVMEDWEADPVLEEACDQVVAAACPAGLDSGGVMSCLMEQLSKGSPAMTSSCSEVLMQIHYFLAREVIIDDHLYQACSDDAARVCKGGKNWHLMNPENPNNQLVFPCLVRNLYPDDDDEDDDEDYDNAESDDNKATLSDECVIEVERTLRQRAMSVNLHPDIEEECRSFLHTVCLSHTKPGEELGCLQEHLNTLEPGCRHKVEEYTKIESRNPSLHPVISRACTNLIENKCGAENKVEDGAGVMECLVRHKIEHPRGSPGAMNHKVSCIILGLHFALLTSLGRIQSKHFYCDLPNIFTST